MIVILVYKFMPVLAHLGSFRHSILLARSLMEPSFVNVAVSVVTLSDCCSSAMRLVMEIGSSADMGKVPRSGWGWNVVRLAYLIAKRVITATINSPRRTATTAIVVPDSWAGEFVVSSRVKPIDLGSFQFTQMPFQNFGLPRGSFGKFDAGIAVTRYLRRASSRVARMIGLFSARFISSQGSSLMLKRHGESTGLQAI